LLACLLVLILISEEKRQKKSLLATGKIKIKIRKEDIY